MSVQSIAGAMRMKSSHTIQVLLEDACPAIRYRIRTEILGESPGGRAAKRLQAAARAVDRLIALSPRPVVRVRHRSRWLGPATIYPHDLALDLRRMPIRQWPGWFETFELFARMGVVPEVKPLARQLEQLVEILDTDGGLFRRDYPLQGAKCRDWGPYMYGSLGRDWEDDRRTYDLTFRCLLILHHAGRIET